MWIFRNNSLKSVFFSVWVNDNLECCVLLNKSGRINTLTDQDISHGKRHVLISLKQVLADANTCMAANTFYMYYHIPLWENQWPAAWALYSVCTTMYMSCLGLKCAEVFFTDSRAHRVNDHKNKMDCERFNKNKHILKTCELLEETAVSLTPLTITETTAFVSLRDAPLMFWKRQWGFGGHGMGFLKDKGVCCLVCVVSSHSSFPGYPHIRRPPLPDYHSAAHMAQLARHKQMATGHGSQSHDGIYPSRQQEHERQSSEGRSMLPPCVLGSCLTVRGCRRW